MEIYVQRDDASAIRTIGILRCDDLVLFTLEDPIREGPKVMHNTAIPAGRYGVIIDFSQRFKKQLPRLLNVPQFEGIRIHAGNTAADTSGCLLVGLSRSNDSILSSALAMAQLQPKIAKALALHDDVWITIANPLPSSDGVI